jgi:2-(1,2-epoxy-1,2-dihydrophenyl)acetyl-CoA isomerase
VSGVRIERRDAVSVITLDRPDRLNALDEPTRLELAAALTGEAADAGVGAVVLTGSGRAFCVGQDLSAEDELEDCADTVGRTYNPIARAIIGADVPVVAAVNGAAVGAGLGIALSCDLVFLADGATLSSGFGLVGLVPDTGASWYLAQRLGHARAFEFATSNTRIGAAEAVELGLANAVIAPELLLESAVERAALLAAGPRLAFALTKRALREAAQGPLDAALDREAEFQGIAARDPEHLQRRAAFLAR